MIEGGDAFFQEPYLFVESAQFCALGQKSLSVKDRQISEIVSRAGGRGTGHQLRMVTEGVDKVFEVVRNSLNFKVLGV